MTLVVFFQLRAYVVSSRTGLTRPLGVRLNLQVVLRVIERLPVEMKLLSNDCAIKQRHWIVGFERQNLAEVFERSGVVSLLGVRGREIDENLGRLGGQLQRPS